MKLRNKKTGEIIHYTGSQMIEVWYDNGKGGLDNVIYSSLADLNEDWEDYEEAKGYWFIDIDGKINYGDMENVTVKDMRKIGNYFKTKEEAEQAVKKLKAWKRLKEARFIFTDYHYRLEDDDALITYRLNIEGDGFAYEDLTDDLRLLFGGEDEQRN